MQANSPLETMSSTPLNIGIAGAGIMGRLLAWQLSNLGHKITVFDKDPIDYGSAAAYTAAGMLTPYSEVESAELLIYRMGMHSLQLWPKWLQQLGADVGFHRSGSLIVAHGSDRADLNRFEQQIQHKLATTQAQLSTLNPQQFATLEPELAGRFQDPLFLPEEAWLCTKCVMRALSDELLNRRVAWHSSTPVEQVSAHCIRARQTDHHFDWAIDTRGLGAKPEIPQLRGVRGELIWLEAPEVRIQHIVRLMHPRYRLYLVPRLKDNLYVIGATQIESDDPGPITLRSTMELLSAAYSLHPGFAEARIVDLKTNCRPALRDNLPQVFGESGLIRINGLFRHGFLLAPAIAESVSFWLSEGQSNRFPEIFKTAA